MAEQIAPPQAQAYFATCRGLRKGQDARHIGPQWRLDRASRQSARNLQLIEVVGRCLIDVVVQPVGIEQLSFGAPFY